VTGLALGMGSLLQTATETPTGTNTPARILSNVDFPEPFGPMSPTRSPTDTVTETFRKRGCAPKAFERSRALMIGGTGAVSRSRSANTGMDRTLASILQLGEQTHELQIEPHEGHEESEGTVPLHVLRHPTLRALL